MYINYDYNHIGPDKLPSAEVDIGPNTSGYIR